VQRQRGPSQVRQVTMTRSNSSTEQRCIARVRGEHRLCCWYLIARCHWILHGCYTRRSGARRWHAQATRKCMVFMVCWGNMQGKLVNVYFHLKLRT